MNQGLWRFRRRALPRALLLAAAGAVMVLAGCGDLSLLQTLQGDSPGELRFSPSAALVAEGEDFSFSVLGGVQPYGVAIGGTLLPREQQTWVFPAQVGIVGDSQDFMVQATDLLGNTATAVVTVYAQALSLDVTEVTLILGDAAADRWDFSAAGGDPPYAWTVDGQPQAVDPDADPALNELFTFVADAAGDYQVTVTDFIGLSVSAAVHVVSDAGGELRITPIQATVPAGGRLAFTALGGSGTYAFSASSGDFEDPNANPATFVASTASPSVTITLTDGTGSSVTAAVTVTGGQPLTLFPMSPTVSAIGDTVQFRATGGVPGVDPQPRYTFFSKKPEDGAMDPVGGRYTQLTAKNVVVGVVDSAGTSVLTVVKLE